MTDQYIRDLLRVSVSQICQTIGYNSIQMTPLELLTDNLHKFLQEFSKDLHRHVELFNRTEANCDDATLTLANLNIGLNDINEYVTHVQAVPCAIDIPKFPARKESYLNFLKPGSKEVLTRPVHIYEYLPPILNDEIDDIKRIVTTTTQTSTTITTTTSNTTTTSLTTPFSAAYSTPGSPLQAIEAKKDDNILDGIEIIAAAIGTSSTNATIASAATTTTTTTSKKDYADDNTIENSCNGTSNGYKLLTNGISLTSDSKPALLSTTLLTTTLETTTSSSSSDQQIPQKIRSVLAGRISTTDSTEGRPTREISSVMMTTGGFISPAIEGKLPDTKIPELIEAVDIAASTPPALSVPSPSPAHPPQQQQQHQQPTQQTASLMPLLSSTSLSTTSPIPSSSNSSAIRTSSNVTNLSMMSSQSQHMLQSNNKSTTGGETADINNPSIKNLSSLRMAKKKNQNNPAMQMMLSNYDRQMMKKVSKRKGAIQSSSSSSAHGSTKFHMSPNVVGSSNLVNNLPQLSNSNLFSSASTQLTTPTAPTGTGTNEKTKKKRLKLIQKSTNKSSSNNNNASGNGANMNLDRSGGISGGNIGYHSKMKNCYNLSKLDRTTEINDKLMRKQHKLKQKRLRHQIQKRQTNQKLLDSVSPMSQNTMHDDILAKKNLAIANNESSEKFKTMRKDTFNSTILQLSQSNNDSINNDTPTAVGGIGIGGGVGGGGGATSTTTATLFHEQSSIASVNANLNDSLFSMSKNKLSTTADEIKLSTEPDRTKLNIFKKISSSSRERRDQKSITGSSSSSSFLLPSDGSAGAAATSSNTLFLNDNHQQQQIGGLSCLPNLPSGTTITPTPPSGRHVYAPPSSSSSTPPTITGATATTPALAAATSLPTSAAGDNCHISEYDGDSKTNNVNPNTGISKAGNDNSMQLINKPKKRGRKPGSKNQPKIPPVGGSHDVNIKKPKKLRMLMNIYGTGHGPQSAHDLMEPLNLTHGSVGTAGGLANIPLGIASTFPLYTQDGGGLRQLKKDHKKGKFKDSGHKRSSAAAKSLSSTIVSSSIVGPTKEEVDSINQKLLKMDTVLQPAPPLLSSPMQSSMDAQNSFAICKNLLSSSPASSSSTATKSKDNELSPTKTSASNSKRQGNSSTSSSSTAAAASSSATISGTPDSSFVPPTFPNMPGMPGLSMFPYYPFPPRPGLIPAHGLFPQLGQMTNSSAGMFLSGLMRFRCMNSGMRLPSLLNGSGTGNAADDNNERNDRSSPQLSSASSVIDVDRNYCNVAPLVPPDTVKFELSNPQYAKNLKTSRGGGGTSMKSASSSSAPSSSSIAGGGSDNMKSKLSPIMTSGFSAAGRSFQSQSSVNSPATQTPAAGHNFAFSDVNKSHFLSSTANTHHGMDIFRNNNNNNSNSNRSMLLKNNLDEGPIEVSDDSDDDDDDGDGNDDGNVGGGGAKKSNQQQFSSNNNSTFTRINTSNSSQRLHDNNDLISGYDQQQQQQQQQQHQHERNKYPFNDSILSNDRSMIKDLNKKKKQKSDKKSAFAITDTDHNIDSNNLMTDEQISTITSGTGTASATSTSTSFVLPKGGNKILNNSNSSGFETISSALGSINNNTSSISSAIVSSSSLLLSAASASFKLINDDQQRHRDHKKLKRINRDGKIKKKKDRKDKSKTKELLNKSDKYLYKFEKRKDKDEKQRDKDRLKKLKKEKKKEKQRPFDRTSLQLGQSKYIGCTSSSTSGISGPGVGLACSSVGGGVGGIESSSDIPSSSMGVSLVPKLTLKLANSQSQMPQMNSISSSSSSSNDLLDKTGGIGLIGKQKSNNKSGTSNGSSSNLSNMKNNPLGGGGGGGTGSSICGKVREPSPELARISPLVTRPPKQKTQIHVSNDNLNQATAKNVEDEMVYGTCGSSGNNSTKTILPAILDTTHIYDVTNSNSNENVIGWMTGGSSGGGGGGGGEGEDDDEMKGGDTGNYISSTTSKPKLSAGITIPSITTKTERTSSLASTTTSVHKNNSIPPLISSAVRPSSYIDAEGNRVWICPACGKVDDGSAMIGCDGCDAWYHWVCVGIFVAPKDNEDWFCRVCITKKKGVHGNDKKRRRNKKKSGNV